MWNAWNAVKFGKKKYENIFINKILTLLKIIFHNYIYLPERWDNKVHFNIFCRVENKKCGSIWYAATWLK